VPLRPPVAHVCERPCFVPVNIEYVAYFLMKMRPTERTARPMVNAMMSTMAIDNPVTSTSYTCTYGTCTALKIHSLHACRKSGTVC